VSSRKPKTRELSEGRPLDASARGALEGLVRIELRSGFSGDQISRAVTDAVHRMTAIGLTTRTSGYPELPSASHVMTVWFDDPRYLGKDGRPKPLTRSMFKALVDDAASGSNVTEMLSYLVRTGNIRRSGRKYVAVKADVILHGIPGPWDERMVRTIYAMLRTANHNALPEGPPWIERTAENEHFPVNRTDELTDFLERETTSYLQRVNTFLRNLEIERKPGDPTMSVTLGVYRSQQVRLPERGTAPKSGSRKA